MAKLLDYVLEVSEFELQLRSYFHLWVWNPLSPPAMGQIVSLLFFYKGGFIIK